MSGTKPKSAQVSEYQGDPIFAIAESVDRFHVFRGNETFTVTLPEKKKVPAPKAEKAK